MMSMNFDTDRMMAENAERRRRERERKRGLSNDELYTLVDPLYDIFYEQWCKGGRCYMGNLPTTYQGMDLTRPENEENRFRVGVYFGVPLQLIRNWHNSGGKAVGVDYIKLVLWFVDAFEKKDIWKGIPEAIVDEQYKLIPILLAEDIKRGNFKMGGKKYRRKRRKSRRRKKKKSRRNRKKSRRKRKKSHRRKRR